MWVELDRGRMKIKGFVEITLGELQFSTIDRMRAGLPGVRVMRSEIEVLPLEVLEEDIEAMIDLALQTKDGNWFMELSHRLVEAR